MPIYRTGNGVYAVQSVAARGGTGPGATNLTNGVYGQARRDERFKTPPPLFTQGITLGELPPMENAATGGYSFDGTATGVTPVAKTATGSYSFDGTAVGVTPVIPPRVGQASGNYFFDAVPPPQVVAAYGNTWNNVGVDSLTSPTFDVRVGDLVYILSGDQLGDASQTAHTVTATVSNGAAATSGTSTDNIVASDTAPYMRHEKFTVTKPGSISFQITKTGSTTDEWGYVAVQLRGVTSSASTAGTGSSTTVSPAYIGSLFFTADTVVNTFTWRLPTGWSRTDVTLYGGAWRVGVAAYFSPFRTSASPSPTIGRVEVSAGSAYRYGQSLETVRTGFRTPVSTATGGFAFNGTAVGSTPGGGSTPASATGSLTLSGTASARATAAAAGSLALGGSSLAAGPSVASGSLTLDGSGAVQTPAQTSGSLSLTGSATSASMPSAAGSLSFSSSLDATVSSGSTGSLSLDASANASASVVGGAGGGEGPTALAAYAFNEGTGTTAAEVNGGTAITDIPGWDTGRHGSGLRVNLTAGPTVSPFTTDGPFTIMFDVMLVDGGNNGYSIMMNDWNHQSKIGNIQAPNYNRVFDWYRGPSTPNVVFEFGVWKHITLVATGTQRRAYADGVLEGTMNDTNGSGNGPIVLGGFGGYEPNMRMDNVRFFNTALSDAEIASLAGTPVTPESSGEPGAEGSLTLGGALATSTSMAASGSMSLELASSGEAGVDNSATGSISIAGAALAHCRVATSAASGHACGHSTRAPATRSSSRDSLGLEPRVRR